MCLAGLYLNSNPPEGGFKCVLVFNRDELYDRPTQPADWWADGQTISGRDLRRGKLGGTWLGMSKTGRLSFLLHHLQQTVPKVTCRNRGSLVQNFLIGNSSPEAYTQHISDEGSSFNPFNLTCMDFSNGSGFEAYYYTNGGDEKPVKIEDGCHGFSNSGIDQPWEKARHAKEQMESIVNSSIEEDTIIDRLFEVFGNDQSLDGSNTNRLSYAVMNVDHKIYRECLPKLVMVKTPCFGTRSTTVVTINDVNEAVFVEKYMQEPIDHQHPIWRRSEYRFGW